MAFIINNKTIIAFKYGEHFSTQDKTLMIPKGIECIASNADDGVILRQYKTIIFPAALKKIEEGALKRLTCLENIILEEGSPLYFTNGCLYSSDKKDLILCSKGIANINIIEGCERIYNYAFWFRDIKSVKMPDSIIMVGDRCFNGCDKLESLVLSQNLTRLNRGFCCGPLKELYIPNSVTVIEEGALSTKTKLIFNAGSIAEEYAKIHNMDFEKLLY